MRNFILGTASAAVLALSFAQPAVADTKTRDALFPILLGIGLIALAEKNNKSESKAVTTSKPKPTFTEIPVSPRPKKKAAKRKLVPSSCYRNVKTHRGTRGVFPDRCMADFPRRTASLPAACKIKVRNIRGRLISGTSANCLRKHGYRMSSR